MVTAPPAFKHLWSCFGLNIKMYSMVNQNQESNINALKSHLLTIYGKFNVALTLNNKLILEVR